MLSKNLAVWLLAFFSAIAGFGGLPDPPEAFKKIAKKEHIQWVLFFIYIMQAGGAMNFKFSLFITVCVYYLFKYLKRNEV